MATIKDVAHRAGVGISTVSRVMNQSGYVSAQTTERVLAAIDALGYKPSEIARSLKRRTTHSIGLLVADVGNPFFAEIARVIEQECRAHGYTLLLCNTDDEREHEAKAVTTLLEYRVDGILWFAPQDADLVDEVVSEGMRVVTVSAAFEKAQLDAVWVDERQGVIDAVRHLASLGHRCIGYIAEPQSASVQLRIAGYRQAVRELDLDSDAGLIVRGTFRKGSGSAAVAQLLERKPQPTAIIAANDVMAIEAMNTLREQGLRVPEDLAVVGFDDIDTAALKGIELTTVAQPKQEVGRVAVRCLLDPAERSPVRIVLEPRLVVRTTCGHSLKVGSGGYVAP